MTRLLFAVVAASLGIGVLGTALAADLPQPAPPPQPYVPAPPPYNWSGFYVGANAGYGFANVDSTATLTGNPFVFATATGSGNLNGFVGGGQIGANWQWNALVFGVEADFQGTSQSKQNNLSCGFGCTLTGNGKIPWFGTFRARVGAAFDRVFVYGTGGVAWMNVSDTVDATGSGVSLNLLSATDTTVGWTAGAGIEVALSQNWTARIEYLFLDVQPTLTAQVPAFLAGGTITDNSTIKDNIVRAGVNFKFSPF